MPQPDGGPIIQRMDTGHQFFVDEAGLVHETRVFEAVRQLKALFPEVDPESLESELMVERCHRLLANDRDAQWVPYGLTGSRFILLRILYTAEGKRLTMGQVALQMNLEPNNVTQMVNSLVKEGLVKRETAQTDKRVVFATLTAEGEDVFASAMGEAAVRIKENFSVLSPQEKVYLGHLLAKVRMHLLTSDSLLKVDHPVDRNRAGPKKRAGAPRRSI